MLPSQDDWAAVAYVTSPGSNQTVLIRDKRPNEHKYWKLPGGKKKDDEQESVETVLRELHEETGLIGLTTRLLGRQNRINHDMYIFHVTVSSYEDLIPIGREGEETALFLQDEVRRGLPDLFPSHTVLLQRTGVLREPATIT